MDGCVFCRIAAGEVPARVLHADEEVVVFHDIAPRAPTHLLVIPRRHIASLDAATLEDASLLGQLLLAAAEAARRAGLVAGGYRVVNNCGAGAGQSVFHIHLHVLGGRPFGWPPG
ncbi:MAG TPA: HIT domain-containing protein [Thermoanaerobaculaceae bacterium]|nr:HIT domain-containing protein [Thermoanaerobaculaceae bacterium]HRS15529.1 HIT domain-containing protein [Thermoanaerobaculaceae bacterium]